jgi:hypothetical protein
MVAGKGRFTPDGRRRGQRAVGLVVPGVEGVVGGAGVDGLDVPGDAGCEPGVGVEGCVPGESGVGLILSLLAHFPDDGRLYD